VSSAEFPSQLKKKSSGQYITADQGFVDISSQFRQNNVPEAISSILKRKSDVSRSVDMTRHTIEPATETTAMSIVKRPKIPSNQVVAVVSAQKVIGTSLWHPAHTEQVTDIATFNKNQDIATVSQNKNIRLSKRKQQNPFGDSPIQDAHYREMTDNILSEMESSPKYNISKSSRKPSEAPRKASRHTVDDSWITGDSSPREFTKGASTEPPSMRAISAQKQKTVSQLAQKQPVKHWGDDSLKRIDDTVDKYITNPATVIGGTAEYVGGTIKDRKSVV
jgi:hypothetical protein